MHAVCARSRSRVRAVFPVCCLTSPLPPAPRACLCVSRQRPAPRSHSGRAANDTESDADHAAKCVLRPRLCLSGGPPVREDRKGRASSPRRSRPTRAVPLSCGVPGVVRRVGLRSAGRNTEVRADGEQRVRRLQPRVEVQHRLDCRAKEPREGRQRVSRNHRIERAQRHNLCGRACRLEQRVRCV